MRVYAVEQSNERVREIEIKYIAQLNESTRSAEERLEKQVRLGLHVYDFEQWCKKCA